MNGKMNGWSMGVRDHVEEMGISDATSLFKEVSEACERWLLANDPGYAKWKERISFGSTFLGEDE